MRKVFALVAFSLLLASCSESSIQKAQDAAALVKKNCGVIVSIADIAAAFSVANPAVTTVAAMAHAICAQADRTENGNLFIGPDARMIVPVQIEQPEPPPLPTQKPAPTPEIAPVPEPLPVPLPEEEPDPKYDCVAVVNGVCIHKEEK